MQNALKALLSLGVVVFFALPVLLVVHWAVNRVYVPEGYSLQLRYKGPLLLGSRKAALPNRFADYEAGEAGVLEQMPGPGRHFYCPIWWERNLVADTLVEPGEVAIVTSKLGDDLTGGQFLVDGELGNTKFKGTLRKVSGPGRYRINPYGYEVKKIRTEVTHVGNQDKLAGWVLVPPGYVGVVTNLADNPLTGASGGIQSRVLQPGIYPTNPREQQIDVIKIGYREKSLSVTRKTDARGELLLDASGEPQVGDESTGINFPSNDGFAIHMDFTAVWGIMPEQAPHAVRTFGNVAAIEDKVVGPQIESICRTMGSTKGAVELLVGASRQEFQESVSKALDKVLEEKMLALQYGLVRHMYIPQEVRVPIQNANIADELKLTRDQEQLTAKTEATLREAERRVELETERIRVETEKMVAKIKAEGQKAAEETAAQTIQLVAAIDKQTAELEAQAAIVQGQARAEAERMLQEAQADKFRLAVEAFGNAEAYSQWVFANGLPENIELRLLYAGQGTLWTDLKGFTETLMGRQVQQTQSAPPPPTGATSGGASRAATNRPAGR